jgi:uroporphyrinogen-III synthase
MNPEILILRPQPGADSTALRARGFGLEPVVAPLFTIRPLRWNPPDRRFGAVMLTSANAPRQAGGRLASFLHLPCFTVGEATAEAARGAGFVDVRTGKADGAALLTEIAETGLRSIVHPAGRDHIRLTHPDLDILHVAVYASEPAKALPAQATAALGRGALALLHSPRAAMLFALLTTMPDTVRIAAISAATAAAAGDGWAAVAVAARPRDEALLELAAELCQTDPAMRHPNP